MFKFTHAACVVAGLTMASTAMAEEISVGHFVPPQHVVTSSLVEPFAKAAESNGSSLKVHVYPGGELGAGPLEQYVRAVQGVADVTWGLPGYTSSQFSKTMLSELPGVKKPGRAGYDMLWDAYDAGKISGEFPRTVPLALYMAEPNVFIMKDHEIRKPEDLAGLKIRVSGAAAGRVIEALGATPVQLPANELYNALQMGLIDGLVTGSSAIADFKLDEVANSYTLGASLGQISFFFVMNEDRYNALGAAEKAAIDSIAGRKLSKSAEDGWNAKAKATIEAIKVTGDNTVIELSAEEAAPFDALTAPLADKIAAELEAGDTLAIMRGDD
ncbi:TRAP transporter substrate-binding protein [Breoghania sp.]|uniref:TRAP transporter substrate-binding protein n=1 Tax=Breoghania sp. TaxID=2065378 RepID=UPI002AA614FB|nr:TRAP transporter substrate-binding protein [Breoghania sp.]